MERARQQIEALAEELGVKRNAILQWRFRGKVPHRWRLPILVVAKKRRIKLQEEAFDGFGE